MQQEIDNIKKSPMMNMTKWTHESKGFMAVLARLGEITHILLKIPKVIDGDFDQNEESISLKSMQEGIELSEDCRQAAPPQLIADIAKFNVEHFLPNTQNVFKQLHAVVASRAAVIFSPLEADLDRIFEAKVRVEDFEFYDLGKLDLLVQWSLEHDYAKQLQHFVGTVKVSNLQQQVDYIFALQNTLPVLAKGFHWWVASDKGEDSQTMDARKLDQATCGIFKDFRVRLASFQHYASASEQDSLKHLFDKSDVGVLKDRFRADIFASFLVKACTRLLGKVSDVWTQHLDALATRVTEWCPPTRSTRRSC